MKIITLCGSVRFRALFDEVNARLTAEGFIVLQPGIWDHAYLHTKEHNAEFLKDGLDKLHCEKISLSSAIFVINPGGYVGKSTASEIAFARAHGKEIIWLEPRERDD